MISNKPFSRRKQYYAYLVEEIEFEGALQTGDMVDKQINLLICNFTFVSLMFIIKKPHKKQNWLCGHLNKSVLAIDVIVMYI